MKFGSQLVDEIKSRIKVSDIVSKKVKLAPRGKEFVGLSPFQMKKLHLLQCRMKRDFIIVLALENMGAFLIL